MVDFRLERTAPLPLEEAWRRLTEWPRHGDVVPLTRVTVLTPPPTGEGTMFVARSGLGPLAFDDRVEVTVWRPAPPTAERRRGERANQSRAVAATRPHTLSESTAMRLKTRPSSSIWAVTWPLSRSTNWGSTAAKNTIVLGLATPTAKPSQ